MLSETQAQEDFARCFTRALRAEQDDLGGWDGSHYRELVAGVHPRAVAGLVGRTLGAFLQGFGLAASPPAKGEAKGADLLIAGHRHTVRTATAAQPDRARFTFHGLDKCAHRVVLLGFVPRRVYAWVISPSELTAQANTVQGDLRIEIDAATPPWSTGRFGGDLTAAAGMLR